MLPVIKLKKHLHSADGKSASIVTIISIDQMYQQNEAFEAFCLKLNSEFEAGNCHKVTIIETGYLKRHYFRLDTNFKCLDEIDLAAIQLGNLWVERQKTLINKLKMPINLLSWKEILETQVCKEDRPFSEYLAIVENDYINDKCFYNHVKKLSEKYSEKLSKRYNPNNDKLLAEKCQKAARDYLLEESSVIFKLVHYSFTHQLYPGAGNAALRYIHRKYFGKDNPLPWVEYKIQYPNFGANLKTLKDSGSFFFQAGSCKNDQSYNLKKNIILQLDKLEKIERKEFIIELYEKNCQKNSDKGHKL